METKGTKAILNGIEVNLLTCKNGFWGSSPEGIVRDGKGAYKVFTKAEAKKGREEWLANNKESPTDSLVVAKIEEWKKLLQGKVSLARSLAKPKEQRDAGDILIHALATTPFYTGLSGDPIPAKYKELEGEDQKNALDALAAFDEAIAANRIVSLLAEFGIKRFNSLMLSADRTSEYDMAILAKCMNPDELKKASEFSDDNTWMYARIEVEKQLALVPSEI